MSASAHRILVLDGHPDAGEGRYLHALAAAYARSAREAGHELREVALPSLDFVPLRTAAEFASGEVPPAVGRLQEDLTWANHLVVLFPLWLGDMPGQLKSLLEQVLRPGFAFAASRGKGLPRKLLQGRSARIIVTMGMPAFFYRWYYGAHSVKNLERNILRFCGYAPVRTSIVGMVEGMSDASRQRWLRKVAALGKEAL